MRMVWIIVFMNNFIFCMNNQIIPITTAPSDTSSVSDEDLCSWALTRFCGKETSPTNPDLTAAIARRMRESVPIHTLEENDVHDMVIQAVNEALEEKEKQIRNRISKRHSAYIAIATGVISTTITALAAIYNTTHNKCS